MQMDQETHLEERIKEMEFERETEIKATKERTEKLWKKKFDDRETILEERLRDLDAEMTQLRDKHHDDLKRERERAEVRIRDGIRVEVRNEVADELSAQFL